MYDTSDQLVLVLNATEEEERGLQEETGLRLKTIDYEMPAAMRSVSRGILPRALADPRRRQDLYKGGGICSVTSRILVVDMLTKKVPVELLTGIVVFHAERYAPLPPRSADRCDSVTPTSLESFIVRIYRDFNKVRRPVPVSRLDHMLIPRVRQDSSWPSRTSQSSSRSGCRPSKPSSPSSRFARSTSGLGASATLLDGD